MQNIALPNFLLGIERSYSIIIMQKFYARCLIQPVMQVALQLFHFRSWHKITALKLYQQIIIIIHKDFYAIIYSRIKICLSVQQGWFGVKLSLYAASHIWHKSFPLCSNIFILCHFMYHQGDYVGP